MVIVKVSHKHSAEALINAITKDDVLIKNINQKDVEFTSLAWDEPSEML